MFLKSQERASVRHIFLLTPPHTSVSSAVPTSCHHTPSWPWCQGQADISGSPLWKRNLHLAGTPVVQTVAETELERRARSEELRFQCCVRTLVEVWPRAAWAQEGTPAGSQQRAAQARGRAQQSLSPPGGALALTVPPRRGSSTPTGDRTQGSPREEKTMLTVACRNSSQGRAGTSRRRERTQAPRPASVGRSILTAHRFLSFSQCPSGEG